MTAALIFVAVGVMLIQSCLCDDAVFVKEGDDVTFNCSVEDARNVWLSSWDIIGNGSYRKSITYCVLQDFPEPCPPNKGLLVYRNTTQPFYSNLTVSNYRSFMSQLKILNATATMRHTGIECVLSLMADSAFDFIRHKSYTLNVYALPKTAVCSASINKDSDVSITCHISKVYPKIACEMFIESATGMGSNISDPRVIQMLEPVHMAYTEYMIARYQYYNVSCNAKYVPMQNGNYRFHCKMYMAKNFNLMSVESNWVTVDAPLSKYQKLYPKSNDTTSKQGNKGLRNGQDGVDVKNTETNTAFYMLLGSITLLGLSGLAAIFWVTRSRCRQRYALADADFASQSNIYELIEGERSTRCDESPPPPCHGSDGGGERVDDNVTRGVHNIGDNSSIRDLLLGTYDNQTIQLLQQCIAILRSNQNSNGYITPCTPQPTPPASTHNSTHGTPSGNDGLSDNDINTGDLDGSIVSNENMQCENIQSHVNFSNDIHGNANSSHDIHGNANPNDDNYDAVTNGDDIGSLDSTFNSSQTSFVCEEIYIVA